MKRVIVIIALVVLGSRGMAQNGCGATLNSSNPTCQVIGSGSLNSWWTVISRHGEYAQNETECNIPSAITQGSSLLTITTTASAYTCGDFNENGTLKNSPTIWPYSTGDMQWTSLNFTYGTVIVRMKLPNINTNVWPAIWFMDSVCQNQNIYSGDPSSECPPYNTSNYREIDMIECLPNDGSPGGWCNFTMHNGTNNPVCNMAQRPIDANFHTYIMSWRAGAASETFDGVDTGCLFSGANVPSGALFMIMQIQTAANPLGPPTNANLPASMVVDYVKVCNSSLTSAQCVSAATNDSHVIFYDDFTGAAPAPPTGLTATPH